MADRLVGSERDLDANPSATSSSSRLSRSGSKSRQSASVSFADESEPASPSDIPISKEGRRRR